MKILFVSEMALPGKSGGIEQYTFSLSRLLMGAGHDVALAVLHCPQKATYVYEGIPVRYLEQGLVSLVQLMKEQRYDICHFQEYSGERGIHLEWIKAVKPFCRKLFFTFHLPYLTCYKNDFRYKGVSDCSNFSDADRCMECVIATKMNSGSRFARVVSDPLMPVLKKSSYAKRVFNKIKERRVALTGLLEVCDEVFVIANWFKDILSSNGFDARCLKLLPALKEEHLLYQSPTDTIQQALIFAGRVEQQKGLHLLCRALQALAITGLTLDVYGNITDQAYFDTCQNIYAFQYKGIVSRQELQDVYRHYDFLVLPSVFTEMYPLVLMEAIQQKIPVIASDAKGNKGLINEGKNGFLFAYDDYHDLCRVLKKVYQLKQTGWRPETRLPGKAVENSDVIASYYHD